MKKSLHFRTIQRNPFSPALKVSFIFLLISFLWILLSDIALEFIVAEHELTHRLQTAKGWFFITVTSFLIFFLVKREIRKKEKIEYRLLENEQNLRMLFENMNTAFAYHKIITDPTGKPIDYQFLDINPAFEIMTGLKREQVLDRTILDILPHIESHWIETYGEVALTGSPKKFSNFSEGLNKYFEVSAYSPHKGFFAVTFHDISKQIENQKEIKQHQHNLKKMINDVFAAEEREKRRLAVDLHDHFSQLLAIAKMKMSEYLRKQEPAPSLEPLWESKKYIDEALQKTRAMTYELCPPVLYELGLINAMEWLFNSLKENYHFNIRFFKKTNKILFNKEVQIIIYRTLDEMMKNIIKHAHAKTILIYIEQVNDLFYLRVIDDGVGFDPNKDMISQNSFGLFSIRERIENLQGSFQIVTAPGRGTIIDIAIPTK
jgi:PAS domain S-box-containing protein